MEIEIISYFAGIYSTPDLF